MWPPGCSWRILGKMMVRKEMAMDSAMQNRTRLLDTVPSECLHDRSSSLWHHEMGDQPELGCACVVCSWCVRLISETGTQLSAALPCVSQCLWTSMELVRWPITMQLSDSLPCVSQCLWTSMELVRMLWLFWINCCIVSEKLCLGDACFDCSESIAV